MKQVNETKEVIEFREKFTENNRGHNSILQAVASWEVEEWLTTLLSNEHQRIKEVVEGMREKGDFGKPCCYMHYCCNETGYNQALEDVSKRIDPEEDIEEKQLRELAEDL